MNTYPTHHQTLELKYNKINAISTITQFFPVPMSPPSLMLVIWFERSGHAGHYRTLVNQLVSFNLEQVHYTFKYHLKIFLCELKVYVSS